MNKGYEKKLSNLCKGKHALDFEVFLPHFNLFKVSVFNPCEDAYFFILGSSELES